MISENITTIKRVSTRPEKGERHYIVFNGIKTNVAENLLALMLTAYESETDPTVTDVREEIWQKVMNSMEDIDGVPAFRLPNTATDEDAELVLLNVRKRFAFCINEDGLNALKNLGQRHSMN